MDETPLTLAMNVLRENPRLQYLDDEVIRDKLMNVRALRAWNRSMDEHERDKAWSKLILDSENILERDRKRAAWHLKTCDMSVFGDNAEEAYRQLHAHAVAGLLLGMQSAVALSIPASLTGRSKRHCGRWRERLMNAGYLRGTLGRPRTKTDPGGTARIIFPTPEDTPYGFHSDAVLPELTDEQAALIRHPMNVSRQARLNHAEKLVELSPRGKRAKNRVDEAVATRGHISSKSLNHTISQGLDEDGYAHSSGVVGSAGAGQSLVEPPDDSLREQLIETMTQLHYSPHEMHQRLLARGMRGIR